MKKLGLFLILSIAILALLPTCKKDNDDKDSQKYIPVLFTLEVSDITQKSAESGGKISDDGGSLIVARGVCWSIGQNPTINDNKTTDGIGRGSFISWLKDLEHQTTYFLRAYATNAYGTAYGNTVTFTTKDEFRPCPGISIVTDIDGNVYNTVQIGDQCWMKENLKTTHYRNGMPIEHLSDDSEWLSNFNGAYTWYDNDPSWKDIYGALYNWFAANNADGLCPSGWHVPTEAEWTKLVEYIISIGIIFNNINYKPGNALKSCRQVNSPSGGVCNTEEHPRWTYHPAHSGFDEFGFSGQPGGFRESDGFFSSMGGLGFWWSATEASSDIAWSYILSYNHGDAHRYFDFKVSGLSVRCLKDY